MVVMDKQDYKTEAQSLLDDKDTYRPLSKDPTAKLKRQLINILKTKKPRDKSTRILTKNFILLVPSHPSSMPCPKATSQAPPLGPYCQVGSQSHTE